MKQLIPQQKIDDAAMCLGKKEVSMIRDQYDHGLKVGIEFGFEKGAQFALNEIQPLVVEFGRKCYDEGYNAGDENATANFTDWNVSLYGTSKSFEQLLEEFINSKNKENE